MSDGLLGLIIAVGLISLGMFILWLVMKIYGDKKL